MGGHLSARSEVGEGSCFLATLPIRREAPVGPAPIEADSFNAGAGQPAISRQEEAPVKDAEQEHPQILIIEDNPDVVFYLQSCLEGLYNLNVAYNGLFGIEKAIQDIPDLIISDVMLPGKGGFEICSILKNDERTSHIPIILLTAKADVESRLEGLSAGADAYLSKPFVKEELLIRLEKLLELRRKLQERYTQVSLEAPTGTATAETSGMEAAFLQKVNHQILAYLSDAGFSNAQLASKLHLSESQLFRKLKALTGRPTGGYIRSIRLLKGKELLQHTQLAISEIAYEVGFTDPSYFSRAFSKEFGESPSAARPN